LRIKLRPIGLIKSYVEERDIDVLPGCTSRTLIKELRIPEQLKMVTFVNGKKYKLDDKLQENDEVKLVTLVTGG